MRKLDMEIKCKFNPYLNSYQNSPSAEVPIFHGQSLARLKNAGKSADIFVKRPDAIESADGLSGLIKRFNNYRKNYVNNIRHTYDHKMVFALVEKEIFGRNSIDSITHDSDKMILYHLGFPKSFVTKYHRKHSEHHAESGKIMNLRSMLCDNIASSPEFKPEKKYSLREHYQHSKELQSVKGFKDVLEKYNYGEDMNFNKILNARKSKLKNLGIIALSLIKGIGVGIWA